MALVSSTENIQDYFVKLGLPLPEIASRQTLLNAFLETGLPSKKQENWKYTSLNSLNATDYSPMIPGLSQQSKMSFAKGAFGLTSDSKNEISYNPSSFHFVQMLNGEIVQQQSLTAKNMGLKKAFTNPVKFPEANASGDSLDQLFAAMCAQWHHLDIAADTILEKPIFIHHLLVSSRATQFHEGFVVNIGARAKVSLLLLDQSEGDELFHHTKIQLNIGEFAEVEFIRLQELNSKSTGIEHLKFTVGDSAKVSLLTVSLGAKLFRQNIQLPLACSHAEFDLNGIYALSEKQHVDFFTKIDHLVGGNSTRQIFKGILNGSSRLVFNGQVFIAENAHGASSAQLNKNLLLSSEAEVNSKPQLEIYADDVKATHGSTVGQLNQDEVFYLLSRCIPKQRAIEMLSLGFVSETIHSLQHDELREFVLERVKQKFARMAQDLKPAPKKTP